MTKRYKVIAKMTTYLYDELQAYFRELEDLREEHDNDLRDEEYSFGEDESKEIK